MSSFNCKLLFALIDALSQVPTGVAGAQCARGRIWATGCHRWCFTLVGFDNAWCDYSRYECICPTNMCWDPKGPRCVSKIPMVCSVGGGNQEYRDCQPHTTNRTVSGTGLEEEPELIENCDNSYDY